MKSKKVFIALGFFLVVNTRYFWESKIGILAFPLFALMLLLFFILVFLGLRELYYFIEEGFIDKKRLFSFTILLIVLVLIYYKPYGLIDFEKFESKNLLVAEREGVANCFTTLKLKEDSTFIEKTTCFVVNEIKGTYRQNGETIIFSTSKKYAEFAILEQYPQDYRQRYTTALTKYEHIQDTVGYTLGVILNELSK